MRNAVAAQHGTLKQKKKKRYSLAGILGVLGLGFGFILRFFWFIFFSIFFLWDDVQDYAVPLCLMLLLDKYLLLSTSYE